MPAFESWYAYGLFADRIRRESRHLLDPASTRFLKALIKTSAKRARTIKRGELLWRAQLGHDSKPETIGGVTGQVAVPYSAKRMKPLQDRATEGRVNAKGIPCLYLSTDRDTAMSEVRPWIGSYLTVAQFRVFKELRVVDCAADTDGMRMGDPSHPRRDREGSVWSGINASFSQPVSPSDNVAEYAPTQVLAESFRNAGYEGVMYRSTLGRGMNVALFNPALAQVFRRSIFSVSSVHFEFFAIPTPPRKSRRFN